MVQPQSDAPPRESQSQTTDGVVVESKKVQSTDKLTREKKRSIFKKPIQMPGRRGYFTLYEFNPFSEINLISTVTEIIVFFF